MSLVGFRQHRFSFDNSGSPVIRSSCQIRLEFLPGLALQNPSLCRAFSFSDPVLSPKNQLKYRFFSWYRCEFWGANRRIRFSSASQYLFIRAASQAPVMFWLIHQKRRSMNLQERPLAMAATRHRVPTCIIVQQYFVRNSSLRISCSIFSSCPRRSASCSSSAFRISEAFPPLTLYVFWKEIS